MASRYGLRPGVAVPPLKMVGTATPHPAEAAARTLGASRAKSGSKAGDHRASRRSQDPAHGRARSRSARHADALTVQAPPGARAARQSGSQAARAHRTINARQLALGPALVVFSAGLQRFVQRQRHHRSYMGGARRSGQCRRPSTRVRARLAVPGASAPVRQRRATYGRCSPAAHRMGRPRFGAALGRAACGARGRGRAGRGFGQLSGPCLVFAVAVKAPCMPYGPQGLRQRRQKPDTSRAAPRK